MISLTRKQFDVLSVLAEEKRALSQRQIQDLTGHSLGSVNHVMKELVTLGCVENGSLTPAGIEVLEPYRVQRAVFIAAGFSSRLAPVTLNTPKPLVRVKGKRIIDNLIDAVLAAGIREIYIVRGYLAEQFDQLLYQYPMIRFIENPAYNETNNISSAVCARYLLSNAYVLEADLLLSKPGLIRKYQYSSNFLGIYRQRTDDWCFLTRDRQIIKQQVGGTDCYQEIGISYWTDTDGRKLSAHLLQCYEMPGGKERYWDQVPLVCFPDQYSVEVRPCLETDVIEIDTFRELKSIDPAYGGYQY